MAFGLPRIQAIELCDAPWAPRPLRDTVVEALGRMLAWGRILEGLVAPLERFLVEADAREVLDLGAGSGEAARVLARAFQRAGRPSPRFLLTDLHPRPEAWERARRAQPEAITFVAEPVDATRLAPALTRGRACLFLNVLHHFPPEVAAAALASAAGAGRGVFVAEIFDRNPLRFAGLGPVGLAALAATPALSDRDRLAKAAITWLSPLGVAASIWDGLVSSLRIHEERELRAMVAPLAGWRWRAGSWPYRPFGRGVFFYGLPARALSVAAGRRARSLHLLPSAHFPRVREPSARWRR